MNNLAFIQKFVEAYKLSKDNPIRLYSEDLGVRISINNRVYKGETFDQCIAAIKESLSISYLEEIERK